MGRFYVVCGSPGTGKTSVLRELQIQGFTVYEEAARKIKQKHQTIDKIQEEIFEIQKQQLRNSDGTIISDRGLGDTIAYSKFYHQPTPKEVIEFAEQHRYTGVFLMDFLGTYKTDNVRTETPQQQRQIHQLIQQTYEELGYTLINVPLMSIKERVEFIKAKVL